MARQRVMRQCMEIRKRRTLARDPLPALGRYGGLPLWTLHRDMDRVVAYNHPRLRWVARHCTMHVLTMMSINE